MVILINTHKRGKRTLKLKVGNPLDLRTTEVVDAETGETIDGVTSITFPHYERHRLYHAEVTIFVTDIELEQGITVNERKSEPS